jgi:acetyl-CoA carboxylase biotin carboxyl carrier protein
MIMKVEDIRRYAEIMKEFGLSEIEITEDDNKIRLSRTVTAEIKLPAAAIQPAAEVREEPKSEDDGLYLLKSPMVGVFYHAPAEDAKPYVKVGDQVKKGDVIGLIEAMKLMNEVLCDCDGTVESFVAENASPVDFGAGLIKIRV